MKILIVEDDAFVSEALTAILRNQNYVVEVANNGLSGWELIENFDYDLLLLDVMLPKLDGISLCRQIRAHGLLVPILLITGRDSSHEKAIGLDAGADDYLVKPFDVEELVARVRALLRRGGVTSQPILEWGKLRLDPTSCEVSYDDQLVPLTPKEYALLELFLRNSRRVFSCGMILEHLWSYEDTPGEEAVRTHIKGLRQKLKDKGASSSLIETVYGIGYRLKSQSESSGSKQKDAYELQANPASHSKSESKSQQTALAINKVWHKFKGRVAEQVNILEEASQGLVQNALNQELHCQAKKEAHTLAGSLGTFGFPEGSKIAHKIERLLKAETISSNNAVQLGALIKALQREIELEPQHSQYTTDAIPFQEHSLILAVDDDPKILELLQTLLTPWGLRVKTLAEPRAFWETLEAVKPDLLILDVEMPGVNGIELCSLVRNYPYWSELPILFLTVHNDADILNQVFSVGADDFVSKPFVGPELVTRIINRLERTKLVRRMAQQENQRLALFLEAAEIGIWDWNILTGQIIWSETQERLFGMAPGSFDGSFDTFINCVLKSDRESLHSKINQVRSEHTKYHHEFRIVWRDGSTHWIEARGQFYYNDAGEAMRMLGTVTDISTRKKIEADLRKSKDELEIKVAERARELIRVNEHLLELNERYSRPASFTK
ncbi:hypothetical protein NIES2101_32755 [Calothrix sp. HK-06]|nr:hypothetical protein NIES2101_32755 [Calothrix sp. HK-06]